MDDLTMGKPEPQAVAALCPYCKLPVASVSWIKNEQAGLVTIYHNQPSCMFVLGCHMVPVEQPRVALPNEFRPRGRG